MKIEKYSFIGSVLRKVLLLAQSTTLYGICTPAHTKKALWKLIVDFTQVTLMSKIILNRRQQLSVLIAFFSYSRKIL